ncbi:hypothetical protein HNR08_003432 [Cellulomonas hominis]|uniref:Uncharacterized protein n=1 Tax=Cellulomonas hominis TaxID=156981 RepID=A0A7W8WB98_9CELL|nr:hypothetical protein [Cellulomonas hominis]MBB5474696.1 hypothetical protein [Cellulomonas hominis]
MDARGGEFCTRLPGFERVFDTGAVGIDRVPMRDMARQVPPSVITGARVTRPDEPPQVRAWIVDGRARDVEVDGEAVAWTPRAVHVHYVDAHGREGWVWVWASAVTRRP